MPYTWNTTVSIGTKTMASIITEINDASSYITSNHCASNYTSNLNSYNSSVNSTQHSTDTYTYSNGNSSNYSPDTCAHAYYGSAKSGHYVAYTDS